jgi:hypothetical protein
MSPPIAIQGYIALILFGVLITCTVVYGLQRFGETYCLHLQPEPTIYEITQRAKTQNNNNVTPTSVKTSKVTILNQFQPPPALTN